MRGDLVRGRFGAGAIRCGGDLVRGRFGAGRFGGGDLVGGDLNASTVLSAQPTVPPSNMIPKKNGRPKCIRSNTFSIFK